ncbi:MAG TPA: type 4a pilus biogenesis protein PilO [Tepidisphaeraceae bacterium]|jgi:type IV pilus assembly protein PilO|nr:type 4a pilus biogenesis protein PilO [Tepidisphaeraceae bacterium]
MKLGFREILFVCVIVGLLACTYLFVFKKAVAHRADLRAEIDRKETALSNLRQATAGVEDLNKMVVDLEQAIHFFDSKLPQEKEVDQILKEVWQLAAANNLTTKTIKTMKSEMNANYNELPIQLALSGNFYGYYTFLQQLEKLPRITRVTDMKLTKIDDRDGDMQAQMTLSIFFEPEHKTVATAN